MKKMYLCVVKEWTKSTKGLTRTILAVKLAEKENTAEGGDAQAVEGNRLSGESLASRAKNILEVCNKYCVH
jgi:hypothetical protein